MSSNYSYTGLAAGSLKIQKYQDFRGVDFTDTKVNESRSPDALNMWKDYKSLGKRIETRPDIELQLSFSNTIYGLFFYTINQVDHYIIHSGTSLYDYNPNTKELNTIKSLGMNPSKSVFFVYNNILFIKDGLNYLEYDGETCKDVEGTIPTISIHNLNTGSTTQYQDVNLISSYRKEEFLGDGETTEYHLNSTEISDVTIYIDGNIYDSSNYTVDSVNGIITFNTAPAESTSSGNVMIKYKKTVSGNAEIIKKCKLACVFDKRVFFSGNQDYPNMVYWCGLDDPRYVSDMYYAKDGTDISQVKALVPGNNALWVFKEPSQANTTVFYHSPSTQYDDRLSDYVKVYPETHSSISTGCKATGINFNDDIIFFSDRGMEGISSDITTEQVLAHRSTLVDRKLLNEESYEKLFLVEWEGYLLVITDDIVYLADSRQKITNNDHTEYEWFYWKLSKKMQCGIEHNNILYLCSQAEEVLDINGYIKYTDGTNNYWYDKDNNVVYDTNYNITTQSITNLTKVIQAGIYTLTDKTGTREIDSYWCTNEEDYNYPQMLKTTNKRGFKSDVYGTSINIDVKTDNNDYERLGTYENTKGYIVAKLKRKKWNTIQLKFSSTKPFGLYAIALESYIGSYVKRS